MAEVFALIMVAVAFGVVIPLAFRPRKKSDVESAAKPQVQHAADAEPSQAKRQAHASMAFPWQDAAVNLVALLQVAIAGGVLLFAYSVYQATPTAEQGGLSSLNFFAQFWLGAMFVAAIVAFSTGVFTYLRHPRHVVVCAALQILMGGLFLLLGNWTFPLAGALAVFAVCSVLVVREAKLAARSVQPRREPKAAAVLAKRA